MPVPARYNTLMKLVFLISSAAIVYYMRFDRVVRMTYDKELDTFRTVFLVAPCAVLALLINQEFSILEVSELSCTAAASHSWVSESSTEAHWPDLGEVGVALLHVQHPGAKEVPCSRSAANGGWQTGDTLIIPKFSNLEFS